MVVNGKCGYEVGVEGVLSMKCLWQQRVLVVGLPRVVEGECGYEVGVEGVLSMKCPVWVAEGAR